MWRMIVEGGWVMWPILALGLYLMVVTARYAWEGGHDDDAVDRSQLRAIVALMTLLTVASLHGSLLALAEVFWFLESPERSPDAQVVRTLFEGLKESTRPAAFGGGCLVLSLVLFSVGSLRRSSRILQQRG